MDSVPNSMALNKELETYTTDIKLKEQIDIDFKDLTALFMGDPDKELFKIKYETLYNSFLEGYENETRWIKK